MPVVGNQFAEGAELIAGEVRLEEWNFDDVFGWACGGRIDGEDSHLPAAIER